MNRTSHGLVIHDEGLPTERAAIRSGIPDPAPGASPYNQLYDYLYKETALPPEMSEYVIKTIRCHDNALARECGERWMRGAKHEPSY